MKKEQEVEDIHLTQLATRIPKNLHKAIKLYCVNHGTSVMAFVQEALSEMLTQSGIPKKKAPVRKPAQKKEATAATG